MSDKFDHSLRQTEQFLKSDRQIRGRWNHETWQRGTRSNSGVRARLNQTCCTISELNPVCHDSTAAFSLQSVTCSFCVQSAILSGLIRSLYSRGTTTTAAAAAARTKTTTGRHPCQQRQLQGCRNRQRQPRQQPRTTVAKCASWQHVLASHWCRADMRGSVKRALCVCQLWMGDVLFVVRILPW